MIYYKDNDYTLYQGKMQEVLDELPDNSIDSIVTDPPYCLSSISKRCGSENAAPIQEGKDGSFRRLTKGFMGKQWDNEIAMMPDTWKKAYRVLKRGGYLLAFGGTRTFHRIACAIEDAGFEIRDTIMWLYGSGFPKSLNIGLAIDKKMGCPDRGHRIAVANRYHPDGTLEPNGESLPKYESKTELGKQWQGWGTALKPAYEPIIVARKPIEDSVVNNVLKYGVGGINIDECRVGDDYIDGGTMPKMTKDNDGIFKGRNAERLEREGYYGRFPANIIHDGSDEVCEGMPDTKSEGGCVMKQSMFGLSQTEDDYNFHDQGSASRYFYSAKASKKDRDEGLDIMQNVSGATITGRKEGSAGLVMENGKQNPYAGKASPNNKNTHPTVKPVELMQYLIRLVTPKNGTILDPFMGSGSTGKATMFENRERNANYKFVGIEMTDEYLPIAKARIDYAKNVFEYELEQEKQKTGQLNIFDLMNGERNYV